MISTKEMFERLLEACGLAMCPLSGWERNFIQDLADRELEEFTDRQEEKIREIYFEKIG